MIKPTIKSHHLPTGTRGHPVPPHLCPLSPPATSPFHTQNSCCWSQRTKLCMTLHPALLNVILFLSLQSTKSSKFLSYDNPVLLPPRPPPSPVSRRAHTQHSPSSPRPHPDGPWEQQIRSLPSQRPSLNTSLPSDNFIWMQLLYLLLSQLLLHLSALVLNHHLPFKQHCPVGHGIKCLASHKSHSCTTPPKKSVI